MTAKPDLPTVISIAVVAHSLSTLIHEGVGHGGACLAVGCHPQLLTSMQFLGDESGLSPIAGKLISAGGSFANLAAAGIAARLLRRQDNHMRSAWFFLWLFTTLNLLAATGYLLYSGIGDIGDWADVIHGLQPVWFWRVLLAVTGAATYWLATRWSMRRLGERLPEPSRRVGEASRYSVVSYLVGGALAISAGLFDPGGKMLIVISGAAVSLGGGSALAWGPQLLHDPSFAVPAKPRLVVARDGRWIVAAILSATFFLFVLGPGIRFSR